MSRQRLALIETFKKESEGLQDKFEPRTYKGDWAMPYRLFRPTTTRRAPLVMYLHGSGGLGDDNIKQLGLGNVFGTRVWLLPKNQKRFPCYVVAPQTDRGWIRYDFSHEPAKEIPGFGDGARLALEIVNALCREFAIDERRIYVSGQSMGGSGVWNMIANRPEFFAAAVVCCAGVSSDDGTSRLIRLCGTSTVIPIRRFLCLRRVIVLRQEGKLADTHSTLSTLEWTTMSGSGLSLNQRYRIGCSLNVAS